MEKIKKQIILDIFIAQLFKDILDSIPDLYLTWEKAQFLQFIF